MAKHRKEVHLTGADKVVQRMLAESREKAERERKLKDSRTPVDPEKDGVNGSGWFENAWGGADRG